MIEELKDIIVTDTLGIIRTDIEMEYLAHLFCLGGMCRFTFNDKEFELRSGDLSIVRRRSLIEKIRPSDDTKNSFLFFKFLSFVFVFFGLITHYPITIHSPSLSFPLRLKISFFCKAEISRSMVRWLTDNISDIRRPLIVGDALIKSNILR